ncbi:hypothetical protein DXG01_012282 [Tephrocybe rancida]|nr:hypothetical protein DXG01_012282 [Tephrocybe rancida]
MFSAISAAVLLYIVSAQSAMGQTVTFAEGVLATGTQGPTNPPAPTMGTAINQTSMSRLLSVNLVDDFCIFAPPSLYNISDSETFEVAWCTQQRNNARLIPDGTLTGVSFLKTDAYVQVYGYGDFTKLNIPFGDWGGSIPTAHSAMETLSEDYNQFCLRVCTAANSTYSAAAMCWHELDEMGCQFVMPGNYNFNGTFETCDAEVAYPPGWYPTATVDGTTQFSTFAQYFTGIGADGVGYTVGTTVTPAAPYMTPSSSNCVTTATVSNGVNIALLGISSTAAAAGSVSGPTASLPAATGVSGSDSSSSSSSSPGSVPNSASSFSPSQVYPIIAFISVLSGAAAVFFFH